MSVVGEFQCKGVNTLKTDGLAILFPFYQNDGIPLHVHHEAKILLSISNGEPYTWPCPLVFPPGKSGEMSLILCSPYILKVLAWQASYEPQKDGMLRTLIFDILGNLLPAVFRCSPYFGWQRQCHCKVMGIKKATIGLIAAAAILVSGC